jgi:hypothetical protein
MQDENLDVQFYLFIYFQNVRRKENRLGCCACIADVGAASDVGHISPSTFSLLLERRCT